MSMIVFFDYQIYQSKLKCAKVCTRFSVTAILECCSRAGYCGKILFLKSELKMKYNFVKNSIDFLQNSGLEEGCEAVVCLLFVAGDFYKINLMLF